MAALAAERRGADLSRLADCWRPWLPVRALMALRLFGARQWRWRKAGVVGSVMCSVIAEGATARECNGEKRCLNAVSTPRRDGRAVAGSA